MNASSEVRTMNISQVAAQLFTLRDFLKTEADIASTLKKVREIGYTAVQVSGMGPIAEHDLVKILDGEGLVCCATHEDSARLLSEPQRAVERLNKLGCKFTAYPYPSGILFDTLDQVKAWTAQLNAS